MVRKITFAKKIENIKEPILLVLHEECLNFEVEAPFLSASEISSEVGPVKRVVIKALELLENEGLVVLDDDNWDEEDPSYELTDEGIEKVEKWTIKKRKLVEAQCNAKSDLIVEMHQDSQSYNDAVESLEGLFEAVRSKNDLNITEEEKEQCLVAVKTAKIILSQDKVEESIFHEVILTKLKWVGEKCADVAIAQLVTEAIKALLKLL